MVRLVAITVFVFGWSQACCGEDRDHRKPSKTRIRLTEVRTWSGHDNHPDDLGAAGQPLRRKSFSDYPDGAGETIKSGANPRHVSNLVVDQGAVSIPSGQGLTDATWAWGQFIDHDLDLSDSHPVNGSADIPVLDPADILFPTIFFNRANHVVVDGVREQINEVTSFLDASQVYGSDAGRAAALRTMHGGKLKMSPGRLMPFNVDGLPNLGRGPDLFLAGDIRSNENVVLTSMHTLFVREHNRLADRIAKFAPRATDEEIYQLARKIVGAEIQIITYEEFLPALMGPFSPSSHSGRYRPYLDPRIANEFSGALFRVGHTLLSSNLVLGETGNSISLTEAFTNPDFIQQNPEHLDQLLLGLCTQPCQEIDSMIVDDVRTFLFLPPPFPIGLDLAALNIQRGREHGLPSYNEVRRAYGLRPVKRFSQISGDPVTQNRLREAYGSVDAIDPWVGAISEDHVLGGNVGPLIFFALDDQFIRARDGDRFFHTRDRDLDQAIVRKVINLRQVTFSKVIRWNTTMKPPRDMFHVQD